MPRYSELYGDYVQTYPVFVPKCLYAHDEYPEDRWSFIPSDVSVFSLVLEKINGIHTSRKNLKFADIGCGIPIFALCIKKAFPQIDVSGIEYDKAICDYVRTTVISEEVNVINADAFEYQEYGDYDILYLCTPVKNADDMHKLLMHVLGGMGTDSVLFFHTTNCYRISDFADEISRTAAVEKLDNYLFQLKKHGAAIN